MNSRSLVLAFLALTCACATEVSDDADGADGTVDESQAGSDLLVVPIRTAGSYRVIGFGSTSNLAADVDDGTGTAQADNDSTYVRGETGVPHASHRLAYGGLPSSAASAVTTTIRARAAAGAAGTVQVELYDGATLVQAGPQHAVSGSYQNFTDSFTGLTAADASQLETRVVLRNTAGAGALRYTQIFARVTLTTTTSSLKPPCRGLMTRGGVPSSSMPFVDYALIHVYWNDIESADQTFNWAPIDSQIASLKARGVVGGRLRLYAGIHAPTFVKKMGHAPMSTTGIDCSQSGGIALYNAHDGVGACSTFYWMDEVLDEYEELMVAVAARYDNDPFVREVVDSACMTVYAEPFYRAHADLGSNTRLWQAGLDLTEDRACHERGIELHHRLFAKTRTSLAINNWDLIDGSSDHHYTSWPEAKSFADWARGLMGPKLVLQNNGKGESTTEQCLASASPETSYWCYFDVISGPKGFQTETWERLGGADGLYTAIEQSLGMGANFIELPSGYTGASAAILEDYDQALESTPL